MQAPQMFEATIGLDAPLKVRYSDVLPFLTYLLFKIEKSRSHVSLVVTFLWRWPLDCSLWRRSRCRRINICQEVSGRAPVRSPRLWCGREGCEQGRARVTTVH